MPAAFQPTRLTISTFGPGAACASANICEKSTSVIQWWTSTARRWISGMIALAPPIDSSDSTRNWSASSKSTGDITRASTS